MASVVSMIGDYITVFTIALHLLSRSGTWDGRIPSRTLYRVYTVHCTKYQNFSDFPLNDIYCIYMKARNAKQFPLTCRKCFFYTPKKRGQNV